MANSDNVVRAGLTPKFKDVDVLVHMLTYKMYDHDGFIKQGEELASEIIFSDIKAKEFAVSRLSLVLPHTGTHTLSPKPSASILICVQGKARMTWNHNTSLGTSQLDLKAGSCVYLQEDLELKIQPVATEPLLMFQAFTPT